MSSPFAEIAARNWVLEDGFWRELRLKRLGVIHGVTTRVLGNMKNESSRRAAFEKAGAAHLPAFFPRQVHGVGIEPIESAQPGEPPEADGWIFRRQDVLAGVYAADCMPILVWESSGAAMGIFHSGGRGTEAGMPRRACEAFSRFYGIAPQRLCAAIGPHIGPCCYKVGDSYLDLGAQAKSQMTDAGIDGKNISIHEGCTCCDGVLFYSFRRQKEDSRMMAFGSLAHAF
ncbi:MAG: polyphenol oxidase family protein [Elusimicrobiota bacterium]